MERLQTSRLDAELRIRLEGAAERLERALAQLESATRALNRPPDALVPDDVAELRLALHGWAAVDEALEHAERHEGAQALVTSVRRAREGLGAEVTKWLELLKLPREDGGPAEQARRLVKALAHLGRPAGPNERALFETHAALPWPAFFTSQALALAVATFASGGAGIAVSALGVALFLALSRESNEVRWRLFADRLQLARPGEPLLDLQYEAITQVTETGGGVTVSTAELSVELPTRGPHGLARLLRSMAATMGAATATPSDHAVADVTVDGIRGKALVTATGAYVVRETEFDQLVSAVLPGAEHAHLDQALALLCHLPPPALAQRLAGLPGTWWPSDETARVESPNTLSCTFVREGGGSHVLTVLPPLPTELDALTRGWRR